MRPKRRQRIVHGRPQSSRITNVGGKGKRGVAFRGDGGCDGRATGGIVVQHEDMRALFGK